MVRVLVCGACGGPLPRPAQADRFVTCQFCGATSSLETGGVLQPANVTELSVVAFKERLKTELTAFGQAFRDGTARGDSPAKAFRAAAERELGGLCDPDAITNVVFGIAADFRRERGADITRDPNALPRVATAYLDALEQLRTAREHELNIPFLTATESGPLHFRQHVTIARLTELAVRAPDMEPVSPVLRPVPDAALPAVRPWWRRLLG